MAGATGDKRVSIATDKFDLPLPPEALDYHVFERGDIQRPLLSVGKACDAGCQVIFDKHQCHFIKDGNTLLTGYRDRFSGLYLLPHAQQCLPRSPREPVKYAFNAYELQTIPQLVTYLHACAGYPVTSTWTQAIARGYYITWPGLTAARVRKYLPKSEITVLGHLKLVRQGTRSTSKGAGDKDYTEAPPEEPTLAPTKTSMTIGRQRKVCVCSMPLKELKGIIGTDQTGRFPITSRRNHKYIFIMYDVDTEFIHAVPITSRRASELVRAFKEAHDVLVSCGFSPVLQRLDHETSKELVAAIEDRKLDYELVPPGNHRQNPAERAIQTFKSHFISTINGVDPDFPADAWDELIPQVNITLNLLRECGVNPAHSAYSYIHGPYDFSAHPLAPLGCRAIYHIRANGQGSDRGAWENRGRLGYYIGPALKSYRTWRFYNPTTHRVVESDTAQFFPMVPIPHISMATQIAGALDNIRDTLNEPRPPHTDIHEAVESDRLDAVIRRLQKMYELPPDAPVEHSTKRAYPTTHKQPHISPSKTPHQPHNGATTPRVEQPNTPTLKNINRYRPAKKQRFPIGTRVRVVEKKGGKRQVFIGKAEQYDPVTGLYRVTFDDGEWDEFNDEEMDHFLLIKSYKPQKPSTSANQITVTGYFPKSSTSGARKHAETIHRVLSAFNAGSIYDEELQRWMAYRDLIRHPNNVIRDRWIKAGVNEFARLTQGYDGIDGLDVITFIHKSEMPSNKRATYARYVVDYRPEKDEPWRLRITCGGDKLDYHGDTTTHSASMEVIKLQLNNIISTPGAKCATGDISNMYLNSDLPEAEYVRFRMDLIPPAIAKAYNLYPMVAPDGFVYARVNKAWYGLKQAGRIAHDDLVERLSDAGYKKSPLIEGYFCHEERPIDFTLVVDDFLIKYTREEDLEHLRATIEKHYTFKVDTQAKQYVGINLNWDYAKRTVELSMDGYIEQALLELQHAAPSLPCHSPSQYTLPKFGSRVQYARVDQTAPLPKDKINFIQRAVGKLLYYARAVDPTMLHGLNDISINVAKGTEATLDAMVYLLNYAHTYPSAKTLYRASDMILRVDSDAAYLVAPEARSRAGGIHYLSNKEGTLFNGPVLVIAKVIKNVMASAAEAELGAMFMNGQEAIALRNCLEAMGYPQPATPLKTDNNTANGIINNTMKQKRSKAIDVRFYWLRDRVKQGHFYVFWESGKTNLADFYTKHHPPQYHKVNQPIHTYVKELSPESLQGCIRIMNPTGQQKKNKLVSHNPSGDAAALIGHRWMADRGAHTVE